MSNLLLAERPVHLGPGSEARAEPTFTNSMDWYDGYLRRHADDGEDGWLISYHTFTEPWDSWEVHPEGSEVVVCTAGEITMLQEVPGGETRRVTLKPGEFIINEPGVWHTADVHGTATALFITAGKGTEARPR